MNKLQVMLDYYKKGVEEMERRSKLVVGRTDNPYASTIADIKNRIKMLEAELKSK